MLQLKKIVPHLYVIGVFTVIVLSYFSPMLTGKKLSQSDNIQLTGTQSEVLSFKDKGREILWTNAEFSGMPRVTGWQYSPFRMIYLVVQTVLSRPLLIIFSLFIGFYILLKTFDVNNWIAGIGGFAYTFSTFNILSIEAGHDYKVMAIALMAPTIAGLYMIFRQKKFLKGGITLFVASGLQLYFGHVQITYYLLIICLLYFIFELIHAYRKKTLDNLVKATIVTAVLTLLAFGTHSFKYIYLYQYGKSSTRGGSELQSSSNKGGLTKDYAFAWSNGALESFTLLFPYVQGGSSGEALDRKSDMYERMRQQGVGGQSINQVLSRVPLYWGDQPFTGGPIYFGILISLFFVFGMRYLKDPIKWWVLTISIMGVILAMGKNAPLISNFFFDNIPLYNKFRSVTMIMCLPQLGFSMLGFIALDRYLKEDEISFKDWKIPLMVIGGIGVIFLVSKGMLSFSSPKDAQYGYPEWLIGALEQDRSRLLGRDIFRALLLVGLFAGVIYLYTKNYLKSYKAVLGIVGFMVLADLWLVNRRYLDKDDFTSSLSDESQFFVPSTADQQIQLDKSYYRVFNLARNPFADGLTSYHHFSVGGYSGIKIQRYQEVIDQYLGQADRGVLNMLNAKYFIVNQNGAPQAQLNSEALGNAWLVKNLNPTATPDEELNNLGDLAIKDEALVEGEFLEKMKWNGDQYSANGTIVLTEYDPEILTYDFSSDEKQFVVFSEIYYQPGWQAYIDDAPVDHVRANYILRAMEVPAGKHTIVFKYEPPAKTVGIPLEIVSFSLAIVLLLIFAVKQNKPSGEEMLD